MVVAGDKGLPAAGENLSLKERVISRSKFRSGIEFVDMNARKNVARDIAEMAVVGEIDDLTDRRHFGK